MHHSTWSGKPSHGRRQVIAVDMRDGGEPIHRRAGRNITTKQPNASRDRKQYEVTRQRRARREAVHANGQQRRIRPWWIGGSMGPSNDGRRPFVRAVPGNDLRRRVLRRQARGASSQSRMSSSMSAVIESIGSGDIKPVVARRELGYRVSSARACGETNFRFERWADGGIDDQWRCGLERSICCVILGASGVETDRRQYVEGSRPSR